MRRAVCGCILVCLTGVTARAEPSRAELAARADAFWTLCDQLLATRGSGGMSVLNQLLGDAEGEVAIRRAAREACSFSECRVDGRKRIRVTATLDLSRLRDALGKDAVGARLRGVVGVLGEGAIAAVGMADVGTSGVAVPVGWENTTAEGVRLAELAARQMATALLVERLGEQVGREVAKSVGARVTGAAEYRAADFGGCQVCTVSARVRVGDALRAGYVELSGPAAVGERLIEVRGFGIAPRGCTLGALVALERGEDPEWAERRLIAAGRGAGDVPAAARQAAVLDATVTLAREIDALRLPAGLGGDVRSFILEHAECDDLWSACLDSVRVTSVEHDDGECRVVLESDLTWLWGSILECGE